MIETSERTLCPAGRIGRRRAECVANLDPGIFRSGGKDLSASVRAIGRVPMRTNRHGCQPVGSDTSDGNGAR